MPLWAIWITVVCQLGLPHTLSASTEGWRVHWSAEYSSVLPLVITLVEPVHWEDAHTRIAQESPGSRYLFAQMPVYSDAHQAVADTLNQLLNQGPGFGLRQVYLLVIGSQSFAESVAPLNARVFAKCAHWTTDQPAQDATWFQAPFAGTRLRKVLASFQSVYLWPHTLARIRTEVPSAVPTPKPRVYLGYGMAPTYVHARGTSSYVVDGFVQQAIQVRTAYTERFSLCADLAFSFNLPDVEAAIQQAVLSQVDLADLASGSEVQITLNETFRGHLYGSASVGLRHTFHPQANVQPYLGVGLGLDLLSSIELQLDTTITLTSADITAGAGAGRPSPSSARSPEGTLFTMTVPISAGLNAALGERLSASGEAGIRLSMNALNSSGPYAHLPYLSLGLNYRLTTTKEKRFYRYVGG